MVIGTWPIVILNDKPYMAEPYIFKTIGLKIPENVLAYRPEITIFSGKQNITL